MAARTSAPGKLMLFGEHAVVYGYPCIVTAVDLRYYASAEEIPGDEVIIETPATAKYTFSEIRRISAYQPETSFVTAALKGFYNEFGITSGVRITTDGPEISYGLGSSSAITVATVAALAEVFEVNLDKKKIFDMAYSAVLDVQGKGSGFDVAAAVYGGTIYYQNGGEVIRPIEIDELPIVIGFSGEKVSTTNYMAHVSQLRDKHPALVDKVFEMMGDIVIQAENELVTQNWERVGDLADLGQGLLDGLGVSTAKLNTLIYAARENGAWGAKLSGAGGGDCMFGVVHPDNKEQVKEAIEEAGGRVVGNLTHAEGVRIES